MPLPAPTECNVPSGSTCPLPPLMMILPPTILAGSEPVEGHPPLVNVHAPSKFLLSSFGIEKGAASAGGGAPSLGRERNANFAPLACVSAGCDRAIALGEFDTRVNSAHQNAAPFSPNWMTPNMSLIFGKEIQWIVADNSPDRKRRGINFLPELCRA